MSFKLSHPMAAILFSMGMVTTADAQPATTRSDANENREKHDDKTADPE